MTSSTHHPSSAPDPPTGESYTTRERVRDRENPHGELVVIESLERRADRFELTDGVTVASVNRGYDAASRVVLCVYERRLDKHYPEWRTMSPSNLRSRTRTEHDQKPAGVHALPAGRLKRYEAGNYTDCGDRVRCHNCESWVASVYDWLEHTARACPGVSVDG